MLLVPPILGLAGFATAKDKTLILYVSPSGDNAHDRPSHSPDAAPRSDRPRCGGRESNFLAETGIDTADSDGDGVSNLIEYATHMNPATSDSVPQSVVKNGSTLEFTYTKNKAATDVTFTVELSDTLDANSWSNSGVTEQLLSDNGTVQTVRATVAAGGSGKRFLHLKISKP